MRKGEQAVAKFREGYSCAQSVFYSFCDELQFDRETALKIACGLGAGMGRMQEVCGAVTGGIIVIGARYGRGEKDDPTVQDLTYAKTRELMERFSRKHGTYICRQLLGGCELLTEEGQQRFKENELREKICVPCIRSVVETLEDLF